jgi:hypothetical protein
MIFDIATFKIKVQCRRSVSFHLPESFFRKFNAYRSFQTGRVHADFTITIVPYDFFPLLSKKLVRRQSHLYYEKKRLFVIKSRSATACVNAAAGKMTLGFKTPGSQRKSKTGAGKNNAILMGFVRLAVSLCAVQKGGLPFHCSAIAFGDRGIAFSGPSGAGKSTIAKLLVSPESSSKAASSSEMAKSSKAATSLQTAQLLNDDFNIILPSGKKSYRIFSTPFTQPETLKKCVKGGAELRTVFFIEKSTANIIENLSFKNKYILVLGQTFIFPLSDSIGRKILDNAERLCGNVECLRLRFKNDGSFRKFMDRYAKGVK